MAGGVVTFIVLGTFISLLLLPALKLYQETKRVHRTLFELVQKMEPKSALIKEAQEQMRALTKELEKKQVEAENKEIQIDMMTRLQQFSWQNRVVLVAVKPMAAQTIGPFQESVLTVELLGQYFDLFHWLQAVEEAWPASTLKRYVLERFDRGPTVKEPRLLAKMDLAFYQVKKP